VKIKKIIFALNKNIRTTAKKGTIYTEKLFKLTVIFFVIYSPGVPVSLSALY
jgi:hypothetical protein